MKTSMLLSAVLCVHSLAFVSCGEHPSQNNLSSNRLFYKKNALEIDKKIEKEASVFKEKKENLLKKFGLTEKDFQLLSENFYFTPQKQEGAEEQEGAEKQEGVEEQVNQVLIDFLKRKDIEQFSEKLEKIILETLDSSEVLGLVIEKILRSEIDASHEMLSDPEFIKELDIENHEFVKSHRLTSDQVKKYVLLRGMLSVFSQVNESLSETKEKSKKDFKKHIREDLKYSSMPIGFPL